MLLGCRWSEVARDLPPRLVRAALAVSGLFELEPLRHTPFLQADLRLTRASARRLSPALFAPPEGTLLATVGALESEEFLHQSRSIRDAWGARRVPVCETIPGTHHFDVPDASSTRGRGCIGSRCTCSGCCRCLSPEEPNSARIATLNALHCCFVLADRARAAVACAVPPD